MTKNLKWRIPLIAVVIAIGTMILYPPAEKILKREHVKEVDGKIICEAAGASLHMNAHPALYHMSIVL